MYYFKHHLTCLYSSSAFMGKLLSCFYYFKGHSVKRRGNNFKKSDKSDKIYVLKRHPIRKPDFHFCPFSTYGFDLWIKIAHLLFYLYISGPFWQLKFSFIDQCSHCAHEGTGAHSLLRSRSNGFCLHDCIRLGIVTDVTISSKPQYPRREVCCKTQSPFKEGRREES